MKAVVLAILIATPVSAEVVGKVGVDWVGNDILIDAFPDPKVQGVTCHLAYFDRSLIDRLSNGNWFEDSSYSSVSRTRTGPIIMGDIDRGTDGATVFSKRHSLILKSLDVTRLYGRQNQCADILSPRQ